MSARLLVIVVCLLAGFSGVGKCVAGNSEEGVSPPGHQSKADEYRDRAGKRMEFNKCYRDGLPECYRQFQDGVEWCHKNWNRCFPLIEGSGAHASNFGSQILRKCKDRLRQRCQATQPK